MVDKEMIFMFIDYVLLVILLLCFAHYKMVGEK